MRKMQPRGKLKLKRETLVELAPADAQNAGGGSGAYCLGYSGHGTCFNCPSGTIGTQSQAPC